MKEWTGKEIIEAIESKGSFCLYAYAPICGTCQVASKMLLVVKEIMNDVKFRKTDVNYLGSLAIDFEIESVPCLLIFKEGKLIKKIYAFHSVPFLLETIKEMT